LICLPVGNKLKSIQNPFFWFLVPELEGVVPAVYPSTSPEMEVLALTRRVLLPTPKPDLCSLSYRRFKSVIRDIKFKIPQFKPANVNVVIAGYSGKLRRRYEKAGEQLLESPVDSRDAYIKAFVKVEKLTQEAALTKAPRFIQGRDPKYNLALMTFLKPVEHWFYTHSVPRGANGPVSRCVVKGLNQEERAALYLSKLQRFCDPVAISIDSSKHDAHVSLPVLRQEHSVYLKAFNNCGDLKSLLSMQETNVGVTPHGGKYSTEGRRASGDFNTGLGNTLVCYAMVVAFFKIYSVDYDFMVDGDDVLLLVESSSSWVLDRLEAHYLSIGFLITVDVWPCPEAAVHCQCSLVMTVPPIMVRNPYRTLSRCFVSNRYFDIPKLQVPYVHTVSVCEAKLHRGVPVLGPFFEHMSRITSGSVNVDFDLYRFKMADKLSVVSLPITLEARISFQQAFGLDPFEQRLMEAYLTTLHVTTTSVGMTQVWA